MTIPIQHRPKPELFPSDLRALFRELARWAVATSFSAAAVGCASTTTPGGEPGSENEVEWRTPPCNMGIVELDSIQPREPIDYVAAIQAKSDIGPEPTIRQQTFAQHGLACATASDAVACQQQLAALRAVPAACPCPPSLLVTRGDEVFLVTQPADAADLLGSIDTYDEALLAAFLAGQQVECAFEGPQKGALARTVEGGYEVSSEWEHCVIGAFEQTSRVDESGAVDVGERVMTAGPSCVAGRRPDGLVCVDRGRAGSPLGRHFAGAAHLEGASVFAFDRLARELTALEAPDALVQWARRSAIEEIRHTSIVGALAMRFGGVLVAPKVAAEAARSPFAIALENAVEGCVRETFGALIACHQALAARDEGVREAMRVIAEDETRHAELSFAIARWLHPQLSAAEREQLAVARAVAFAELRASDDLDLSETERSAIGWPTAELSRALLTRLEQAI